MGAEFLIPERERLLAKVSFEPNGCWRWTGYVNAEGYGRCGFRTKCGTNAHRAVYIVLVGAIPAGMTLDHECHNRDETCVDGPLCMHRRCVNPQHVVVRTRRQNVLHGRTSAVRNAAKTHCDSGHEFTAENTYIRPDGCRSCKECKREQGRRYDAKRRGGRSRAAS